MSAFCASAAGVCLMTSPWNAQPSMGPLLSNVLIGCGWIRVDIVGKVSDFTNRKFPSPRSVNWREIESVIAYVWALNAGYPPKTHAIYITLDRRFVYSKKKWADRYVYKVWPTRYDRTVDGGRKETRGPCPWPGWQVPY